MDVTRFPFSDGATTVDNLDALSLWLKGKRGAIEIVFPDGAFYGTLAIDNPELSSLTLTGTGETRFTGARTFEIPKFRRCGDNIVCAELPAGLTFERLVADGIPATLARFPNRDETSGEDRYATLKEAEARAERWKRCDGAILRALHTHEWGGNSYRIRGRGADGFELEWLGDNNRGSGFTKNKVVVENVLEELDAENEWFYDKKPGVLYLYGRDTGARKIEAADRIAVVSIRNAKSTELRFQGIRFADTDRSATKTPWFRYLRSDWAFNFGAAVEISDSAKITFEHCKFYNVGASCVVIRDYAKDVFIRDCDFTDSNSNGVLIAGNPASYYGTSSWENENHETIMESPDRRGFKSDERPENIAIEDCYFYRLGLEDKQSAGVCVSLAHNVRIARSTFQKMPRAGVNVAENAFGGFVLQDCALWDCVRETGDHGPFNSWGRDRFWSYGGFDTSGKRGLEKKKYALWDMLDRNVIRHNLVVGSKGFGIDLDDGSTNYLIENNICINVGIKLREGFFREVKNNLLLNAPLDLHVSYAGNDDTISHNAIFSKEPIRTIALNRGHTTKVFENVFLNARKGFRSPVLKGAQNRFATVSAEDAARQAFRFPEFQPVEVTFGKKGAPLPELSALLEALDAPISRRRANIFGVFATLDEALRSRTGAPDLTGVYVERLTLPGKLRFPRIKAGDLLRKIDGREASFDALFSSRGARNAEYEAIRNQTVVLIKNPGRGK